MRSWTIPRFLLPRKGVPRRVFIAAAVVAAVGVGGFCAYRATFVGRYGRVDPGRLYRSRQPGRLQYPVLFRVRGIRRVINLRSQRESPETYAREKAVCRRDGVEFFNIPVTALVPTRAQAERFVQLVATSPGPVLAHCQMGRNRTGMMCAVYRVAKQGMPVEQAFRQELTDYNVRPSPAKQEKILALLKQFAKAPRQRDPLSVARVP